MKVATAYSQKKTVREAIEEIKNTLSSIQPSFILYFASVSYPANELAEAMQQAFPNSLTTGCSTAGEIVSGKLLKNSIVAMGFTASMIKYAKAVVVENIQNVTTNNLRPAFEIFEKYYGEKAADMDISQYIGLVLVDGLSRSEEKLMESIGNLTNVMFIGGSAGDDLKFQKTFVYAGSKAYTNAAVLVLLKPSVEFQIIKTQSFVPLDKKLIATKVDEPNRTVLEFNNKPAALAYAEALNVPVEAASQNFMRCPVGLMVEDEPYVRSPQQIQGNKMVFYCNIKEGMELSLLESGNIVEDTKKALDLKLAEMGQISALINFHCILRTLELEAEKQADAYGAIFADIPTIGFSTYGEQFVGHINQTSTMLAFK